MCVCVCERACVCGSHLWRDEVLGDLDTAAEVANLKRRKKSCTRTVMKETDLVRSPSRDEDGVTYCLCNGQASHPMFILQLLTSFTPNTFPLNGEIPYRASLIPQSTPYSSLCHGI